MGDKTELQEDIVRTAKRHSDRSDEQIAAELDCSASYVNQVRNDYADEIDEEDSGSVLVGLLLLLVALYAAQQMGLL